MLYKFIKGDTRPFTNFDPSSNGYYNSQQNSYQNYNQSYNQNPYQNSYQQSYQSNNRGYGRRMTWQYVPGFGWRYVEEEYGPQGQNTTNSNYNNFYEDFEDFFENAQRQQQQYQYNQQQQQQSWSYEDLFGNRSGMTRQEAYRVLGLQ